MQHLVGLKQFRERLATYEKKIRAGASFTVVRRNRPIFTAAPVDSGDWETVIDFTKLKAGGVNIHDVLNRL